MAKIVITIEIPHTPKIALGVMLPIIKHSMAQQMSKSGVDPKNIKVEAID